MFYETAVNYHGAFLPFRPDAVISDRSAWSAASETGPAKEGAGLSPDLITALIQNGEAAKKTPWPQLLATDYLDFTRTGNREQFETKQFGRRTKLNDLILAECAENQGRFLDEIINGLTLICEEAAWQLPAHNSYIRDTPQLPLPDVTRPVLDLFAAETGAVLATARFCMKPALDSVSPFLSSMISSVLEQRIFTPYLNCHFWWMGDGVSPMNNWTIWCTQNVLMAAALSDLPEPTMRAIFEKACKSVDYFLAEYSEDGCCDEGAQYYRHAGLCLFGCMEILNSITDGQFRFLYEVPKIRNIAAFIENVHVSGRYYINFSDCSPAAGRCNAREFLFGLRTKNPSLAAFAAKDYLESEDPLLTKEHNLYYRLLTVFQDRSMRACEKPELPVKDICYPGVGLYISRDSHFCLAVKAGDNDDSHNHNDTGSFTLYRDGRPMFADIGVETYQKKTFSPQRYEIWTMQSGYHNLVSFLGEGTEEQQHNGASFRAKNVVSRFSDDETLVEMELCDAYPSPLIHSYVRSVRMEKGRKITIHDRTDCGPLTPVLSLITSEEPFWDAGSGLLTVGALGSCLVTGAGSVKLERLPITDKRLLEAWEHDLWRVRIAFRQELILEIRC